MILLEFAWDNIFSLSAGRASLADRGLCLVTGENCDEGGANGSGKSSFASKGVIWTLYGQTPGGIKADAVINRHSKKKSGWGSVTFMSQGEEYTVKRYRPAKLRLWKGPDEITAKKVTDTQDMVDQALGRDFKTFLQTEMFGQGRAMSYAALGGAEQKKVLEQILPIETLDEWAEEAKVKAGEVKILLNQAKTSEEVEAGKLITFQQQFEKMKKTRDEWTKQNEQAILDKRSELEKYGRQIENAKQKIEQIDTTLSQVLRPIPEQTQSIRDKIDQSVTDSREANAKWIEAHAVYEKWVDRESSLHRSLPVKIESLNCPTCNRPWDEQYIKEHNDNYTEHFRMWKEAEVNRNHAKDVAEQYKKYKIGVENQELELKSRYQEMQDEERKFNDLMAERNLHEHFLAGKPTEIQKAIDTLMLGTNPHRNTVDDLSKELATQRKEVTIARERSEALDKEHEDLLYWQRAYSKDMKLKLFAAACPFLDQATTKHLKALENSQLHVQFSTVKIMSTGEGKEDFNVRCWNDTGGEGYDSLSGGEQQMISFAIGRALADLARTQTAGEYQFQILDEPFTELDGRNFEAVVNYLQGDIEGTILLISNDEYLKSLISERIHVVKKNGISEVVV
jgi:DNA repair exonuclease SbcCD ATPase subunit